MSPRRKMLLGFTPDVVGLAGIGLMSWGAWMVSRPAGAILLGVLLLAGTILYARGGNT